MNNMEWEKELDKFIDDLPSKYVGETPRNALKDFIRSLLTSLAKEIEGKKLKIKSEKMEVDDLLGISNKSYDYGYNSALSVALSIINALTKAKE